MSTSPQASPGPTAGKFQVEIQGVTSASFREMQGLTARQVADYRAGNAATNTPLKVTGLNKYSNVTLKRGVTHDLSLWNWINGVMSGNVHPATVVINLLDEADNPVLHWRLGNARPRKWSGPVLNAGPAQIAIEELVLAYEEIDWGLIPRRVR